MPLNRTFLAALTLLNATLLCGWAQAQSVATLAAPQAEKAAKAPGEPIRIVCASSIPAGNRPLFIIDGRVLSEQDAKSINPDDIDKIDVLKSTAATALYGSRAANGAVLITLKHRVGKYLHQPEAKKDHLD